MMMMMMILMMVMMMMVMMMMMTVRMMMMMMLINLMMIVIVIVHGEGGADGVKIRGLGVKVLRAPELRDPHHMQGIANANSSPVNTAKL